jgi:hypothetical protein
VSILLCQKLENEQTIAVARAGLTEWPPRRAVGLAVGMAVGDCCRMKRREYSSFRKSDKTDLKFGLRRRFGKWRSARK